MKTLIVVQGRLTNQFIVDNIIHTYKDRLLDVVISTWKSEPDYLVNQLKSEGFSIILNEKPYYPGLNNINYQSISTSNAIFKYLHSEYSHVLKIRTDMIPSVVCSTKDSSKGALDKFINVLSNISPSKLVFLCWFVNYQVNYICDFFSFGTVTDSYKFWYVYQNDVNRTPVCQSIENKMFPEQFLTYKYTGLSIPTYEEIKNIFSFSINELKKNNIKLIRTSVDSSGNNLGLDQIDAYWNITNDILKIY